MRYIIACEVEEKKTKEKFGGFCIFDSIGLYPNLSNEEYTRKKLSENKEVLTMIFDNLEDAQDAVSHLTKCFRRDDVWHKEQIWLKSKKIRKFYLRKVDTPKFPFKLLEIDKKVNTKSKLKGKIYKIVE